MKLVYLLALQLTGATYRSLPAQTDSWCSRGYPICTYSLTCLHGQLECRSIACGEEKKCEDLGSSFRASQWDGHCDWFDVENRYECCECVASEPPPETTSPIAAVTRCYDSFSRCPDSYDGSCCYTGLSCPETFALSEPIGLCEQTDCKSLEGYAASELNYMSSNCRGIFPGDQVQCQTCLKEQGSTSTAPTVTATFLPPATTDYAAVIRSGEECDGPCSYELSCPGGYELRCQGISCNSTCDALGAFYEPRSSRCESEQQCCRCERSMPSSAEWELLGTPGNGACRGRNRTDNDPSHYWVASGIQDLDECQALCLQHFPSCKGIEFSLGRCEVWTRKEGIAVHVELEMSGFTCMRFGWPAKHLTPVDGGTGRACRGLAGDNRASYFVVEAAEQLEECKAICTAAPLCYGIEFSSGRCEVWTSVIGASIALEGFSCYAYRLDNVPIFTEKPLIP